MLNFREIAVCNFFDSDDNIMNPRLTQPTVTTSEKFGYFVTGFNMIKPLIALGSLIIWIRGKKSIGLS